MLPEILRGLDVTLILSTVVMFGFSRLSARWTGLVVGVALAGTLIFLAIFEQPSAAQMARVVLQLLIVAVVFLRRGIERKKKSLFMMAKENLRRNIYAAELERAKLAAEEADAAKSRSSRT